MGFICKGFRLIALPGSSVLGRSLRSRKNAVALNRCLSNPGCSSTPAVPFKVGRVRPEAPFINPVKIPVILAGDVQIQDSPFFSPVAESMHLHDAY